MVLVCGLSLDRPVPGVLADDPIQQVVEERLEGRRSRVNVAQEELPAPRDHDVQMLQAHGRRGQQPPVEQEREDGRSERLSPQPLAHGDRLFLRAIRGAFEIGRDDLVPSSKPELVLVAGAVTSDQ